MLVFHGNLEAQRSVCPRRQGARRDMTHESKIQKPTGSPTLSLDTSCEGLVGHSFGDQQRGPADPLCSASECANSASGEVDEVHVLVLVSRHGSYLDTRKRTCFVVFGGVRSFILSVFAQDAKTFTSSFKTSCPLVLACLSVITNFSASQSFEFVTRREI